MTTQQKIDCRAIYNRLRLQLLAPGESLAGVRVKYQPVSGMPVFATLYASKTRALGQVA